MEGEALSRTESDMFAEMLWRKQMAKALEAFEALDAERLVAYWPEDHILEFPAGTPMAGEWRGRAEVTAVMRAVFDHNASIRITLGRLALVHPWSPTGTITSFTELFVEEVGKDGDVYRSPVVSVSELRHWKAVRTRDFFGNVPGCAAHYATLRVPPREAAPTV